MKLTKEEFKVANNNIMTVMENHIIMLARCDRTTANLIANEVLDLERDADRILEELKVEEKLQKLFKILTKPDYYPFIHENSYKDINNDKDEKRREIFLSKMNSYQILETPYNFQEDQEFLNIVGNKNTSNDYVDNSLLYSLLK